MEKELDEREKWDNLRQALANSHYKFNDDWEQAIRVFNSRLMNKFFVPVGDIIDKKTFKGEGFTIVTVQCALIEALATFRTGRIFNFSKNKQSPSYEYKSSKVEFINFLNSTSIFEDHFWNMKGKSRVKNSPFNSDSFYSNVRCGLMHEARTKGKWIINASKSHDKKAKMFLKEEGGKIKIYRTVLHYKLQQYVEDYLNELRESSKKGEELRKFFARKMDHLFDYSPDLNFNWWIV